MYVNKCTVYLYILYINKYIIYIYKHIYIYNYIYTSSCSVIFPGSIMLDIMLSPKSSSVFLKSAAKKRLFFEFKPVCLAVHDDKQTSSKNGN